MRTLWTQGAKVWNKWCYLQVVLVRTFVTSPYLNSFLLYPECIRIFKYLHTQIYLFTNSWIFLYLCLWISIYLNSSLPLYLNIFFYLGFQIFLNIWIYKIELLVYLLYIRPHIWVFGGLWIWKYVNIRKYLSILLQGSKKCFTFASEIIGGTNRCDKAIIV